MANLSDLARRMFGRPEPVDPSALPVYMHPVEFSQVRAVLETLQPKVMLEWGSGGSTKAFLETLPFLDRLVSLEHDKAWFERVSQLVKDDRLDFHHVGPNVSPPPRGETKEERHIYKAWELRCETDETCMADYVAFPATLDTVFDFILVDGRARCFCLAEGWKLLRPGGIMMLHDAQRDEYRAAMEALGRVIWLDGWQQGQVCFVRKPDPQD